MTRWKHHEYLRNTIHGLEEIAAEMRAQLGDLDRRISELRASADDVQALEEHPENEQAFADRLIAEQRRQVRP